MLRVRENGSIQLTRGDTARLVVQVMDETTGEEYAVKSSDVLKLSVKKSVDDTDISFQKVITGSNLFHIEPSDTKSLSFGKYIYDVELTNADGDVYTVIVPTTFEVLKEVD